jgi:glutamate dehydrogenase
MTLYEELLQSDICEDPYLDAQLKHYFPTPLRTRYESYMKRHPLRREIIATYFTNTAINATGITMLQRFREQHNFAAPEVIQGYIATRKIFGTAGYRREIEALDNQVAANLQIEMNIEAGWLIERATRWLLQNQQRPLNIESMVERYSGGVQTIMENMLSVITSRHRAAIDGTIAEYVEAGVEKELATRCATMRALYPGLDIVEVASNANKDVLDTARIYFEVGHELKLFWLREQASSLKGDYWQQLAVDGVRSDLFRFQRMITAEAISNTNAAHDEMLPAWQREHEAEIARASKIVSEIRDASQLNLAMITVAMREIENLVL